MTSITDSNEIQHALLELLGRALGDSADALIREGIPLSALDGVSDLNLAPKR